MFGSTKRETPAEKAERDAMEEATKVKHAAATMAGMNAELQVQKQQIKHLSERLDAAVGLVQTLQGRFDQFQAQRVKELNLKVGGGPTA